MYLTWQIFNLFIITISNRILNSNGYLFSDLLVIAMTITDKKKD